MNERLMLDRFLLVPRANRQSVKIRPILKKGSEVDGETSAPITQGAESSGGEVAADIYSTKK